MSNQSPYEIVLEYLETDSRLSRKKLELLERYGKEFNSQGPQFVVGDISETLSLTAESVQAIQDYVGQEQIIRRRKIRDIHYISDLDQFNFRELSQIPGIDQKTALNLYDELQRIRPKVEYPTNITEN